MDTFTKKLVDIGFARQVAAVLVDCTRDSKAISSKDLAEKIGFLESVPAEVEASLKDRATIKSASNEPRDPDVVRDNILKGRTSFLSKLVGLGAFDGLISDENGNPVSFETRIGLYGGFARVGTTAPKVEKKPGEKKAKNPDAWKRVPEDFANRVARLLEKATENGNTVTKDKLIVLLLEDTGITAEQYLAGSDRLQAKWPGWITDTREGNPLLKDEKGRHLYVTKQGRVGGWQRAVYSDVPETSAVETISTEKSDVQEDLSADSLEEQESVETDDVSEGEESEETGEAELQ